MHDIRLIRENPADFDAALARRGLAPMSLEILAIDTQRRICVADAERMQAERNEKSKQIGVAKKMGDDRKFARLSGEVSLLKNQRANAEAEAKDWARRQNDLMLTIPNAPLDSIPDGTTEADNVELRRHGTPRAFNFAPKEHYDIALFDEGEMSISGINGIIGAKLSGSRFTVMYGSIARLHRALAQFMLDIHVTENKYTEVWTPVIVNEEMLYGTGQLPKFADDLYQLTDGKWLIPTAEVTLTNIVAGEIVDEPVLPLRYTAHTQCFRSEAGSAGKDVRGMLRQHQFEKVEMVSLTRPENSEAEHDRMTRCAEDILERLNIPYRTVILCTGDLGFSARRTHDIEAWLPGQDTYREISSCSVCGDFQARRMNARFRREGSKKPEFLHTLNGSGLAVGRTLIAVMENYQQEDGAITIPEALRPYMRGAERINADGTLG